MNPYKHPSDLCDYQAFFMVVFQSFCASVHHHQIERPFGYSVADLPVTSVDKVREESVVRTTWRPKRITHPFIAASSTRFPPPRTLKIILLKTLYLSPASLMVPRTKKTAKAHPTETRLLRSVPNPEYVPRPTLPKSACTTLQPGQATEPAVICETRSRAEITQR